MKRLLAAGQDFEFSPHPEGDLSAEHERWLCAEAGGPVVVTDFPAAIKPFYMYRNPDSRTVAAMDILAP